MIMNDGETFIHSHSLLLLLLRYLYVRFIVMVASIHDGSGVTRLITLVNHHVASICGKSGKKWTCTDPNGSSALIALK
jgi:hypothetical protein